MSTDIRELYAHISKEMRAAASVSAESYVEGAIRLFYGRKVRYTDALNSLTAQAARWIIPYWL